MPELPEVETVRGGLAPVLEGRRLVRVEARRPDLRFPLPPGFVQILTGSTIVKLERRAKYLLGRLDREDTLVMHLGMSGRFEIAHPEGEERPGRFHYAPDPDPKHAHVVFETEAGVRITYYDPRRFGYMSLVNTATLDLHPWFAGLGPEPLSDDFDAAHLKAAFTGRRQGPKTLLLDQRIVAGLGNIYVCEALNRARISPFKPAGRISRPRIEVLVAAIKDVLREAIAAGGSTLRDYAQADGALGYFQHSFRTYDREGQPCRNDGCRGVIGREVQAGRSTFYCPVCQR
ncbi:formamidopyrimidine-DNA glycosylase [Phenylobacterium zucineum HLK1]|uniref:Formamidopyrimidine-DNA glycosylase n=1 Tax=Phenylobacterium zucineum (strain HLK1) TaxID=450851 RepID=FPG_PHEZH|nr:bifunctional DNA-formamidopyrimidine glycosylase/DNA-(apurinic or apyrimidinic site) lyase [Phenylobacterium zucineum]B4RC43.1 RecName: Full=Formamidopyrimidine-DNA glycosylase; Short=Fapy-DNA glycosylase; AltName: Full=DNA-(apurinic or apyrimidinic site) lyase MutM; Short=AP lyase MutM [Phenylobacterium zucineum HLK1]ACG79836.1 formamidopyrimidine-DNA glycosylase [Phenylobacterium zucineum HLK1]